MDFSGDMLNMWVPRRVNGNKSFQRSFPTNACTSVHCSFICWKFQRLQFRFQLSTCQFVTTFTLHSPSTSLLRLQNLIWTLTRQHMCWYQHPSTCRIQYIRNRRLRYFKRNGSNRLSHPPIRPTGFTKKSAIRSPTNFHSTTIATKIFIVWWWWNHWFKISIFTQLFERNLRSSV